MTINCFAMLNSTHIVRLNIPYHTLSAHQNIYNGGSFSESINTDNVYEKGNNISLGVAMINNGSVI